LNNKIDKEDSFINEKQPMTLWDERNVIYDIMGKGQEPWKTFDTAVDKIGRSDIFREEGLTNDDETLDKWGRSEIFSRTPQTSSNKTGIGRVISSFDRVKLVKTNGMEPASLILNNFLAWHWNFKRNTSENNHELNVQDSLGRITMAA